MTLDQAARYARYIVMGSAAVGLMVGLAASLVILDQVLRFRAGRRPS